jgi:hypothetical protein
MSGLGVCVDVQAFPADPAIHRSGCEYLLAVSRLGPAVKPLLRDHGRATATTLLRSHADHAAALPVLGVSSTLASSWPNLHLPQVPFPSSLASVSSSPTLCYIWCAATTVCL